MRAVPILLAGCLLALVSVQLPIAYCIDSAIPDDPASPGTTEAEVTDQAQSETSFDEKDVTVLTATNFDAAIKAHNFSLVEFYAPWCGHCKTLAPHYAKAATALKQHDSSILIAKVDATEHGELSQRYGVQGFPTMKWFAGDDVLEYGGGRVEQDIIQWVKKKSGPPAKTISDADELKALLNTASPVVIASFASYKGAAYDEFLAVARSLDKVEFAQTIDAAVAKKAGLTGHGIVMHREFEGNKEAVHFDGKAGKDVLKAWVKGESLPPYLEFKEENQDAIFESGITFSALLLLKRKDMEKGSKVTTAVKAAAKATKGEVVWVLVDQSGEAAEQITQFFNIKPTDPVPKVVAFNMENNRQYAMESGPVTEKALTSFAKGVLDGSVKANLKSDEIPSGEEAKADGVTVVVGKNFDDVVKSATHDVLLEAYAPWCGHCQKLAPTYAKLATRFENISSVVIAKIDGAANEHEDMEAEGFPTIWLWPAAADSKPILFQGDRTLKGLTAFVTANAKLPVKLQQTAAVIDAEDLADVTEEIDDEEEEDEDEDEDDNSEEAVAEAAASGGDDDTENTDAAAAENEDQVHSEL